MTYRFACLRAKWRSAINHASAELGRRLIRWAQRDSNHLRFALDEWAIAFPPGDDADSDHLQALIGQNVADVVAMFGLAGHSGFSASYAHRYIEKALRFQPFSPLTGEENEWSEPFEYNGSQQNKRCGCVFRDSDGRAYDIDGKVFEDPSGTRYTSRDSRVYITFPYTPTTEIVKVDDDGIVTKAEGV